LLIFTRCYDGISLSIRQTKQTEYRECVQQFLKEASGVSSVPFIPIFFVDSLNLKSEETEHNIVQFHGWAVTQSALSTNQARAVELRDQVEDEVETHVFVNYVFEGQPQDQHRFAVYQDRTRQKITPYNGDPVQYGEWIISNTSQEPAGHQITKTCSQQHESETKTVHYHEPHARSGINSVRHTHYDIDRITWNEEWTETTDFSGKMLKVSKSRL
jgi:hypothetical protein